MSGGGGGTGEDAVLWLTTSFTQTKILKWFLRRAVKLSCYEGPYDDPQRVSR